MRATADIALPSFPAHTVGMGAFRVLIVGSRRPACSYATLRAALDSLLANRLPDVELATAGRDMPML